MDKQGCFLLSFVKAVGVKGRGYIFIDCVVKYTELKSHVGSTFTFLVKERTLTYKFLPTLHYRNFLTSAWLWVSLNVCVSVTAQSALQAVFHVMLYTWHKSRFIYVFLVLYVG
ncbi:hypothetical protein HOLleu_30976 [Holothuria leucospilota]|uniref:Uncharacterized protein n=1 Tax=Holothuria leucospilota TaxID=206669 RepID=A0A9Q1BLG9_HOLLE|nr:hypothetical protein HOLleu_30976 [Holothuria leucospilota]